MFKNEQAAVQHLEGLVKYRPEVYLQKIYLKFTSGFPDLLVGFEGQTAFYEVKILKTTLKAAVNSFEPIQIRTMSRMRLAGISARGLILESRELAYLWNYGKLTTVCQLSQRFQQDPLLRL